jgi:RluA family pseudouridine synthase
MKIIYEDQFLMIVDKPAGLSVLPDGWEKDSEYLVRMLEEQFGKIFIVHRLDKITSGVMIFARDAETHRALNIQFENHEAQKTYHAILEGNPKWEEKIAKFPLRANVGHKHRTMVDDKNGRPSETRFRVIKRFQESALVEAKPMTGRTHQIRVHAYALGHPLVEDVLYGARDQYGLPRPMLHAQSLLFIHPMTKERLKFSAPHPADFEEALERLSVKTFRRSNV